VRDERRSLSTTAPLNTTSALSIRCNPFDSCALLDLIVELGVYRPNRAN